MWWTYFTRSKPELDHAIERVEGNMRSTLARDAFSIMHFLIVLGIIAFAASVEHALGHPTDPLTRADRLILASSVLLFVGGTGMALWRAGRPVSLARRSIPAITAALVLALATVPALVSLGLVLIGVALVAFFEPSSREHEASASA
jgi:low temperature requirement protein LtrA